MSGCPIEDGDGCNMIKEHHETLYDKEFGLTKTITKKLDKSSIRAYFIAFGGIVIIGAVTVWANTDELKKVVPEIKAEVQQATKDNAKQNTDIEVLKTKFENIDKNIEDIKEILSDIKEEVE
jgi:hypothetical protein